MSDSKRPAARPSLALTRAISPRLAECELTHLARQPIDVERARRQHLEYEDALRALGLAVERIEPAPEHPDAVFVEDTAVVLDELAVITLPGAASRRGELGGVERALAAHRPLARIVPPATLDGGDVLVVGRRLFVGLTQRTSRAGVAQLAAIVEPHGYRVTAIEVTACLHLKTAATALSDDAVLVNPGWIDPRSFGDLEVVAIDPTEPTAANVLRVGSDLIVPTQHPETAAKLSHLGFTVHLVPADELAKAEGGVTCCSLLL